MNILIVDDNSTSLKLLRAVLESEGMQVSEAGDGVEALATLDRATDLDAIVSDVAMPRMDGFRFCMEVRRGEKFSDVPFIAYTASYTTASDERLMSEIGADRFIRKPAPAALIVRTIVETVEVKKNSPTITHSRPEPELLKEYNGRLVTKLEEKNGALFRKVDLLKTAQAELRLTHARLEHVINETPAVIYSLRVDEGRVAPKIVNENITELLGFSVGEALSHEWWLAQLHPDDSAGAIASIAETLSKGTSRTEYRLLHKDGSARWVDDRRRVIYGANKTPIEIVGVWTDITQRKAVETELAETREQWRLLVNTASDGLLVVQDERVVFANPAMARILGAGSADDLRGRRVFDFVHPESRALVTDRLRKALSQSEPLPLVDEKLFCVDGSVVEVEVRSVQTQFSGAPAVLVNVRDITARRRSERRLLLQHRVTAAVAESFSMHDAVSKILKALCLQMGWQVGELWTVDRVTKALRCVEIWTPNAPKKAEFLAMSRELFGKIGSGLPGRTWESGRPVWSAEIAKENDCPRRAVAMQLGFRSWLGVPLKSSGEVIGVMGFFGSALQVPDSEMMDLLAVIGSQIGQFVDRQRLTEQFQQAQKMEALGVLAGGIAHDFNNVLTAITGYGELAKMDAHRDSTLCAYLDGVLTGARRATDLVRQILAFCRHQEQKRVPMRLHHAVGESLRLLQAALPRDIEIVSNLKKDAPMVLADATQIHQVVMNLATNAAHAMRGRPGTLTVRLEKCEVDAGMAFETPGMRPGRYARLTIQDSGHGMDEPTRRRIFEPFFTTKPVGEGTGLGLAVVHGIMKSHEGAITVSSVPGSGTMFHVYFPADLSSAETKSAPVAKKTRGTGQRLLLVDDEPSIVYVSQRMLETLGYKVHPYTESAGALKFLTDNPGGVDAVITDLAMPGVNGRELAKQIATLRPGCPIIVVTGSSVEVDFDDLKRRGVVEVLTKPVSIHELADAVNRALRKDSR